MEGGGLKSALPRPLTEEGTAVIATQKFGKRSKGKRHTSIKEYSHRSNTTDFDKDLTMCVHGHGREFRRVRVTVRLKLVRHGSVSGTK
jgi:hypothetical protein